MQIPQRDKHVYLKDDCPFCFFDETQNQIYWSWKYWTIYFNKNPYSIEQNHLLALPKRHIKYFRELDNDELIEYGEVSKKVLEFFGDKDYFSFSRETMAKRSVEHLHIHFLIWKLRATTLTLMLREQWL